MKKVIFSLLVLAFAASGAMAQAPVVNAGWEVFVIREGATEAPFIIDNDDYVIDSIEIGTTEGGQKAGLATDLINGAKIKQISTLHIDRLDDVPSSGSLYGPYFNIWVTDGLGNYAVIANEPSNPEWGGSQWNITSWDFLKTKTCKVYETPGAGTGTSWLHVLIGNPGPLVFDDVADLVISPPPPSYIQDPANAVGSGAPDNIDDDTAYGYTWVFGDTAANYVTGGDGFIVNGYAADIYAVENVTQGTYFATISAAISAAAAYDVISVGAGTYTETLNIAVEGLEIIGVDEATVIVDPTGFASNGAGIYVNANNVTLESLTMNSTATNSVPRYGIKFGLVDGCTLENVTAMETYRSGIDALGTSNLTILNVSSKDNGGHGLSLVDCNTVTVTNTTYSGNAWQNVSVATWGNYSPLGTSGIVFNGTNDFGDLFQLEMGDYNNPGVAPAGAAVITYSTNSGDGADVTVQGSDFGFAIYGEQDDSPDQVRIWFMSTLVNAALVPANAPFGHWSGNDMYIESLTDGTQLYVTPGGSIKAAIAAANSGDTVNVASGTYVENGQIVVDKNVSVIGDVGSRPIVKTDTSTGSSSDARGWWLQTAGTTFVMENLELDGTGYDIYQGIRTLGNGGLVNCALRNITYPGYGGVAIAAFGGDYWNVTGCTFNNIGRVGILNWSGGTFSGNTYTGKGPGDWLDYAVDTNAGAVMLIEDNTITACQGVASTDGSTSAALIVGTLFGAGTTATINNNILTGNTTGVDVGYDAADASVVSGTGNDFSGNDSYGVSNTAANLVDFTDNDWGDASGPFHATKNPNGTGTPVEDYINFTPWTGRTVTLIADLGIDPTSKNLGDDGYGYWEGTLPLGLDDDYAVGFEPGAFQANVTAADPEKYTKYGLVPSVIFGRDVYVGELYKITYHTKKDTDHVTDAADWFAQFYTNGTAHGWYGERINSEPYFSENLTETPGTWTQWQTDAGQPNRLRFFDSNTNFGSYTDGFLQDMGNDPFYADQSIMLFGLGTGSAWAEGFDGRLDGLTIELVSGEKVTFNFISGNSFGDIVPVTTGPLPCSETTTLTFNFTADEYTPDLFLYNAVVIATPGLDFGTISDLFPFGTVNNNFYKSETGTNEWTITGSTVGSPTSPVTGAGTTGLFEITFSATSDVVGSVVFDSLTLRDPDNNSIPVVLTGATITYDCTAPAAVTAITAGPRHNKVDVSWTHDLDDVDHFEVYRGLWYVGTVGTSAYPEYDDVGAIAPTRPTAYEVYPGPAGEWIAAGSTATPVNAFTDLGADGVDPAFDPDGDDRGVYYYEVFAVDAAGNPSAVAAANDRATNYWLGDVTGEPSGFPNGLVQPYDITALGDAFGTVDGGPTENYNNIIDVGPTDDWSRLGVPTTDDKINFEDLMVFSMNFGVVGASKSAPPISKVIDLAWVRYDDGRQALRLVSGSGVKGLNVRAKSRVSDVTAGDLLDRQSELTFLKNVGESLDVSVAVTGTNVGFSGSGDLFVIAAAEMIDVADLSIKVRGYDNSQLEFRMDEKSGSLTPRAFALNPNYPNPFNPMTKISFSLPEAQDVRLEVYGVDGRRVATLLNETRGPGLHEVIWNGQDDTGRQAASGMYFYRIEAGPYSSVHKMTLMK